MIKFKKILFVTDFSKADSYALDYAISAALEHEACLYVLHVTENMGFNSPYVLSYFPRALDVQESGKNDLAKKRMQELISPQLKRQITVEELVVEGKPYREIVRVAKEKEIDLIVMADHRSIGGKHHLPFTTERVISGAPCAVTVIPCYSELAVEVPNAGVEKASNIAGTVSTPGILTQG
jgi:nucleotide-binding universal stress UspA family protein